MTDRAAIAEAIGAPDRPILFSAQMVRALLEGRKTQTRRMLKPQPIPALCWHVPEGTYPSQAGWSRIPYRCGDRLWVREVFALVPYTAYLYSEGVEMTGHAGTYEAAIYKAGFDRESGGIRWRSPIHMPRWASRLTLTVTDVRVQRLQQISEDDAMAEGATSRAKCYWDKRAGWSMDWSRVGRLSPYASRPPGGPAKARLRESDICLDSPRWAFASYWCDLHGPYAWDDNPWVVALTFGVRRGNIDARAA